ncbi:MAG: hypothetical protein V5804_02735, partial [Mucilaginibacter sp.]
MKKKIAAIEILFLLFTAVTAFAQNQKANVLPAWAFGGFKRPAGINPIISPDPGAMFMDPILKKAVAWESNDTFNPAAAIINGKVVVLY